MVYRPQSKPEESKRRSLILAFYSLIPDWLNTCKLQVHLPIGMAGCGCVNSLVLPSYSITSRPNYKPLQGNTRAEHCKPPSPFRKGGNGVQVANFGAAGIGQRSYRYSQATLSTRVPWLLFSRPRPCFQDSVLPFHGTVDLGITAPN